MGTELGQLAEKLITKGHFIPDEVTLGVVKERLAEPDCAHGYILDGFPRILAQAKAAIKSLEPDSVIVLEVPQTAAVERIVQRLSCPQCGGVFNPRLHEVGWGQRCPHCKSTLAKRDDDTEAIALERMDVYNRLTKPAVEFMKQAWPTIVVDASRAIGEVFGDIMSSLSPNGVEPRVESGATGTARD